MAGEALFSESVEYSKLDSRQKSKFRSYKSRFRTRGLSLEEAEERARQLVLVSEDGLACVEEKEGSLPFQVKSSSDQLEIDWFVLFRWLPLALVSLACMTVLAYQSAEALGGGWLGWVKAILIEVGLVVLFNVGVKGPWTRLCVRGVGIFGVLLAVLVLHKGVNEKALVASGFGEVRDSLMQSRQLLVAEVERLPESYRSRRAELLARVSEYDDRLQSLRPVVVDQVVTFWPLMLLQVFLIFLNLVCCHAVVRSFLI